jgi:hypothetical protein
MMKRSAAFISIVSTLALSTVMCSFFTPGQVVSDSATNSQWDRATIAVLQTTIDAMQSGGQATASAWMTAMPVDQSGTPQVPTDIPDSGKISGKLSYPGGSIPPLRIVAFNTETSEFFTVEVNGQEDFTIDKVPAGYYQLVAYLIDTREADVQSAGYTKAVECGLSAQCTDHSLITFEVSPEHNIGGINPADWSAPVGFFPSDPTQK